MAKVLICDAVADSALDAIRKGGHQVTVKTGMDQDALLETVPGYDAMVVRSATKVRVPVLEHCKDTLKLIVRGGVGLDNIDVKEAEELGIAVRNTPAPAPWRWPNSPWATCLPAAATYPWPTGP